MLLKEKLESHWKSNVLLGEHLYFDHSTLDRIMPGNCSVWSEGDAYISIWICRLMPLSKWILDPTMAYDRDPSDHIGDSDNSNYFWYSDITNGRNINLLGGDSDSKN